MALYAAASTSERISFHTVNRETGHRVRPRLCRRRDGKPVERDDQVKGYETDDGNYVMLEPEEIAAAVPESDKTLRVEAFIACADVDTVYFDKPYYLAPADEDAPRRPSRSSARACEAEGRGAGPGRAVPARAHAC